MPRTRSHAAAPEVLPDGIRAMSSKPGKYECMTCPNRLTSMPLHQALPHGQCSQHIRYFASFRRAIALRDTKERADAEKSPAAVVPCQDSLDFGETGADDPDLGSGTSDVRYDNDLGEENLPPPYSPPLPMTRRGMRLAQRNASFRIVSADRGTGITMGTGTTTTQQLLDDISAVRDSGAAATSDGDYAPFPDKVTFVLAAVANHARRPLSSGRIKSFLLAFKLLGVPKVPSYDRYRKTMADIRERLGSTVDKKSGAEGHTFFTKSIAKGLQSDFANPFIRPSLQLYPRRTETITCYQDSDKAGHEPATRPTMVELGPGRHAYIEEVVELSDGYMYVQEWVEGPARRMIARGRRAERRGRCMLIQGENRSEFTSAIKLTADELVARGDLAEVTDHGSRKAVLHPTRAIAKGRAVYSVPLYVFIDDLSGNRSKRWNKHLACYFQSAAVEAKNLGADATTHLFAASDKASAQELSEALSRMLHQCGVVCWDSQRNDSVLVYAHVAAIVADNPMAAELASNIGMNGSFPCRSCEAGGSVNERSTPEGLAKAATPRTIDSLKHSLTLQLRAAGSGAVATWAKEASRTGVKDKLTSAVCERIVDEGRIRRAEEDADVDDIVEELWDIRADLLREGRFWNPLFRLKESTGLAITEDLPCEILHTILLGTVKYLARETFKTLSSTSKSSLTQWLGEANMQGIGDGSRLTGAYMVKHVRSLVGKDLKRLGQVMHWALEQIDSSPDLQEAWKAQGELAALCMRPCFSGPRNISGTLAQSFYIAFTKVLPTELVKKPKLHILSHSIAQVRRFGPLPTVSAERFESYNTIVREASILSNRKAPSRDIARRVADEEMVRDIVSGAFYFDYSEKKMKIPGPAIRNMMSVDMAARKYLLKAYGLSEFAAIDRESEGLGAFRARSRSVKLHSGDWVKAGDTALLREHSQSHAYVALVKEVTARDGTVSLEVQPLQARGGHAYGPDLDVQPGEDHRIVTVSEVLATLNTNHNCSAMGCKLGLDAVHHHGDLAERVVNTSCFRSYRLITEAMGNLREAILDQDELGRQLHAASLSN
ncbi:hypothetical protein V8E36_000315 [Tilletia maclaganii]